MEGLLICPFEVVKIRLQSEEGEVASCPFPQRPNEAISLVQQRKSTARRAVELYRRGGFGPEGLFRSFCLFCQRCLEVELRVQGTPGNAVAPRELECGLFRTLLLDHGCFPAARGAMR